MQKFINKKMKEMKEAERKLNQDEKFLNAALNNDNDSDCSISRLQNEAIFKNLTFDQEGNPM